MSSDSMKLLMKCDSSQITGLFEWDGDDVDSVKGTVEHFAMLIVSSLAFSLKYGYSVEIISVHGVGDNFSSQVYGVGSGLPREENHTDVFNRSLRLAAKNMYFRLALRDFVRAISDVSDCAFYCYRVLEAISKHYSDVTGRGWDAMHKELGTSKEQISSTVKKFADPIRHGSWLEVPQINNEERREILSFTNEVLLKFLNKHSDDSIAM
eukprot:TRINITY_DN1706_c0_g5_i2.p1 TRINITY_DN1706_c0_g5~~TRINITY_DN1706_c0_g5_i2.p1  ORF type:complete len:209 (+),score=12.92 TRINITY_DN1706_c0_g5_i2:104-730(+)